MKPVLATGWAAACCSLVVVSVFGAEPTQHHPSRVIECGADNSRPAVVTGVSITPDGRTVAAATDDHCVLTVDVAQGAITARLEGHADWVRCVGLSADGKTLASGAGDRSICVWDVTEQKQIFQTAASGKAIAALCFHPNNEQIAVVGFSNRLQIINTSAGQTSQQLGCPCVEVRSVAFSPDGERLAVAGRNGRIRVWNVDAGSQERDIETGGRRIRGLAFSPDSRLLAAGGDGTVIHVFDAATGQTLTQLNTGPAKVHALIFVGNRELASGGTDNRIVIWDLESGEAVRHLLGHTGTVAALACDASGNVLVSGSYDTTLRIWDLGQGALPSIAHSPNETVR